MLKFVARGAEIEIMRGDKAERPFWSGQWKRTGQKQATGTTGRPCWLLRNLCKALRGCAELTMKVLLLLLDSGRRLAHQSLLTTQRRLSGQIRTNGP